MLSMPDNVSAGLYPGNHGTTMVLRVGDTPVHIAFLSAGARLPLRLTEQGKVAPVVEANFYVIMAEEGPIRMQPADRLIEEINAAVGTSVFWEVQTARPA